MKHLIAGVFVCVFYFISMIGTGNNSINTDSLEQVLTTAPDSTASLIFYQLYNSYFYNDPIKARQKIEQAFIME